jgi:hypothetical protein
MRQPDSAARQRCRCRPASPSQARRLRRMSLITPCSRTSRCGTKSMIRRRRWSMAARRVWGCFRKRSSCSACWQLRGIEGAPTMCGDGGAAFRRQQRDGEAPLPDRFGPHHDRRQQADARGDHPESGDRPSPWPQGSPGNNTDTQQVKSRGQVDPRGPGHTTVSSTRHAQRNQHIWATGVRARMPMRNRRTTGTAARPCS